LYTDNYGPLAYCRGSWYVGVVKGAPLSLKWHSLRVGGLNNKCAPSRSRVPTVWRRRSHASLNGPSHAWLNVWHPSSTTVQQQPVWHARRIITLLRQTVTKSVIQLALLLSLKTIQILVFLLGWIIVASFCFGMSECLVLIFFCFFSE